MKIVLFILLLASPQIMAQISSGAHERLCLGIAEKLRPEHLKRRYLLCHMYNAKKCKTIRCKLEVTDVCVTDHYQFQLKTFTEFRQKKCFRLTL